MLEVDRFALGLSQLECMLFLHCLVYCIKHSALCCTTHCMMYCELYCDVLHCNSYCIA